MCEYCDLKKSKECGGIYRGKTMAVRDFFEASCDVPTKNISIFIAKNDMCSSGLGLYLDEGNKAYIIGLRHIDSVSINVCFHCGKSAKEILEKIGKENKFKSNNEVNNV